MEGTLVNLIIQIIAGAIGGTAARLDRTEHPLAHCAAGHV